MFDSIQSHVLPLAQACKRHNKVLTTAESCTGGGIAYHITQLSGSSQWFERGFVTYSNQAKHECLGVRQSDLQTHGAVSEAVARAMAEGALQTAQATTSVAVTGIAGPNGGTADKPVGTVWIAWADQDKETLSKCFKFTGDREQVRNQTIIEAVDGLLRIVQ